MQGCGAPLFPPTPHGQWLLTVVGNVILTSVLPLQLLLCAWKMIHPVVQDTLTICVQQLILQGPAQTLPLKTVVSGGKMWSSRLSSAEVGE